MNGDLPWTPGGLDLLKTIERIIKKNGGRLEMAKICIDEERIWRNKINLLERSKYGYVNPDTITSMWNTHSLKQISIECGKSVTVVKSTAQRLGLTKKPFSRKLYGGLVPVLVVKNGITTRYESKRSAADALKTTASNVCRALAVGFRIRDHIIQFAR